MLGHLISSRYPHTNDSFANKRGYICGREKDDGHIVILNEGTVSSLLPSELYVAPCEEIEGGLLETSL